MQCELPRQEASDPAVREVVELDLLLVKVRHELRILQANDRLHLRYALVNTGLHVRKIVEHAVQELREAPEGIGLSGEQSRLKLLVDCHEELRIDVADHFKEVLLIRAKILAGAPSVLL